MATASGDKRIRYSVVIPIYGGAEIDSDERCALSLPPKFTLFPKISLQDVRVEGETCDTKIRWNRRDKEIDERGFPMAGEDEKELEEGSEARMEAELEEHEFLEVYNPEKKSMDFTKLRPTMVKNNPRVSLPKNRPLKEEAKLIHRRTTVEEEVSEYTKEQSDTDDLTAAERRGVAKLRKRILDGEIVVYETDKSGKLCVATIEAYEKQGDVHAREDKIVTWEEVEDKQKEIVGHLKGLNRIFQPGMAHGEKDMERTWAAKELDSTTIPKVSLLAKDHKEEKDGVAATRPVCGAHRTANGELSEWLADICDGALAN